MSNQLNKNYKTPHPPKPSIIIPSGDDRSTSADPSPPSPASPATPKTPADEGVEFFQSDIKHGEPPIRVYELKLDPDGGPSKETSVELFYIRLPPAYTPYILRVSIDAGTPASQNGVFVTNFPLDGGKFGRDRFAKRKLPTDFSKPIKVDLPISHAGAFVYWVEYDGNVQGERVKGREGYFNIDPILRVKARTPSLSPELQSLPTAKGNAQAQQEHVHLPLDGLSILTLVSKWMGPLSSWPRLFAEAMDRGYTMLHWTPVQERGESNSAFSIRDQMRYDPSMFDKASGPDDEKAQFENMLRLAKEEYGLLNLTDVVLNHTANDTPWLLEHPEAGYSPANTPHLAPALEVDTVIIEFSASLASKGLPDVITSSQDIDKLIAALHEEVKALHLWQYYVLDVTRERESVKAALKKKNNGWGGPDVEGKTVVELAQILRNSDKIQGYGKFAGRFGVYVEGEVSAAFVKAAFVNVEDLDSLADAWVRVVDVLNVPLYEEWEGDIKAMLENVRNTVTYNRLDEKGPKFGRISREAPLVWSYFTRLSPTPNADPSVYSLANNGWVWNANSLQNFALLPSKAYLRREIYIWGDCVKLRYGSAPPDNPWLWSHMTSYVNSLARTFDGLRIDNCHSTPLHVGVALLDAARVINPDLYVCAELFTESEETDLYFVGRLGINSLIRELGNAWDPKELSRLLYMYGLGKPVGSMDEACLTSAEELPPPTGKGPARPCVVTTLNGSVPHALLCDLTHDNESPLDKRSAEDALSAGALATFSYSAIGSVKGFDELYPKLLNLVTEKRRYEVVGVGDRSGIGRAKKILNALHTEMVLNGYKEGHVHQENDYIQVHRVEPHSQKGYLLVAHTAFNKGPKDRGQISPIKLRRTLAKFVFGAHIDIPSYEVLEDPEILRGLPSKLVDTPSIATPQRHDAQGPYTEIVIPEYFPPGSILVFETQLQDADTGLDAFCTDGADLAFGDLDLVDLNVVLYRSNGEERDTTKDTFGAYQVPGLGNLVYCGLEGWMHALRHIMRYNDLGHPLCSHLREGAWALDYVHTRLERQSDLFPRLKKPAQWLKERLDRVKAAAPPALRPKYFAIVISEAYKAARRAAVEQMPGFVSMGHSFTQDLAMCAVQMQGLVRSASLSPEKFTPSLAAGLPHFAIGWARCWGRDIFISLRGLFMTTGNYVDAKRHILAFASVLKHGLIPNLLDSLHNPRYNSRDSPWWMLQAIQDYVKRAPNGLSLLSELVKRRFPQDDTWVPWDDPRAYAHSSTVAEIIQEILQRHADGISFREHGAGPGLDMQMKDEGFNIDIKVDWSTGLILGGNAYNCGTWMDKMGESDKAGNKGVPGTPRDGAPVEITGLLKSTLRWLIELSAKEKFPFKGVRAYVNGQRRLVTYKEWNDLVQESFEKCYYVPWDPADDPKYASNPGLINRRGIYKDVFGSGIGREWSDYQFRPNFSIAMSVAPELFNPQHALGALRMAERILQGPLGMRTLDPADLQYRPHYDNSNDSTDQAVAKGLNYHNGPEWLWPMGYFLRAYLYFDTRVGGGRDDPRKTLHRLHRLLLPLRSHIQDDAWRGLPELTNKDGEYCADSCNTQAWSASAMLDFLEAVHDLGEQKRKI